MENYAYPNALRILPFAAAAGVGVLAAALSDVTGPAYLAVAIGLTLFAVSASVAFRSMRPPAPLALIPSLAFLAAIGAMRGAEGGANLGLALAVLPVLWMALYGRRSQLTIVVAAAALLFIVPVTGAVGGYEGDEFVQLMPWLAVAALVGFTTQSLVGNERMQRRELFDQHAVLDAIFASAGSLMAIVDLKGKVERINPACEKLGGFPESEIVGRHFWEVLMPADDAPHTRQRWRREDSDDLPGMTETEMVSRDGARHQIHWTLAPMPSADGAVHKYIATGLDVTAQRAAQDALEAERDRFDSVLRASTEYSIIGTDTDGLITVFNQGAERLLGYTAEETIGHETPALFHDPDEVVQRAGELSLEPEGIDVFVHAARDGQAETRDWTYIRADGDRVAVSLTVTAIPGPDGEPLGYIGMAANVTAQRAAEAALAESEHQYRCLIGNLPDTLVALYDHDLRCVSVDGPALEASGLRAEDFEGKLLSEVVPPDHAAVLRGPLEGALAGRSSSVEYTSHRAETVYDIEVVPYDRDGEIIGAFMVSRDISRRREAELEARAAEQRFVESFEQAPVGMELIDLDGRFIGVNAAMAEITGYSREDLVGKPTSAITAEADVERDAELRAALLSGRQDRYNVEKALEHADGGEIEVAVHLSIVRSATGGPRYFVGQVVDITERKRLERDLEHMAHHDSLTGLLNRRSFEAKLREHIELGARYGHKGAVIMLDVDNFKAVNDTLGHAKGDELIIAISRVLTSEVRSSDRVGRLGGDEFAILLPEVNQAESAVVAEKLVTAVRTGSFALPEDWAIRISLGVAVLAEDKALGADDALIEADLAMYEAKAEGGDRFRLHARPTAGRAA